MISFRVTPFGSSSAIRSLIDPRLFTDANASIYAYLFWLVLGDSELDRLSPDNPPIFLVYGLQSRLGSIKLEKGEIALNLRGLQNGAKSREELPELLLSHPLGSEIADKDPAPWRRV